MIQRELSLDQWESLLAVLSLDVTVPFYDAMEIPVEDPLKLQAVLRPALTDAAAAYAGAPLDRSRHGLLLLLKDMERTNARLFVFWAEDAFLGYHADQPEWSAWSTVFRRLSTSQRQRLSFLSDSKQHEFLTGYRQRARVDDIRQQKSRWQKHLLATGT